MSRWEAGGGEQYAARFDALAARGTDVHGEAALCESLVPPGARVLDAGCGTGRVAIRLQENGYDCVGVDLDPSMLDVAKARAPQVRWVQSDIADLDLGETFDLVVVAGNVVPLVAEGTEAEALRRLTDHLVPTGILVTGFGLDRAHLPPTAGVVTTEDYDRWCVAAGLDLDRRLATWAGEPYVGGGYAVNIHRRRGAVAG